LPTLWLLAIASGARKAARDALSLARKKSLAEDLEDAKNKVQEKIGVFLKDQKWDLVHLRAEETSGRVGLLLEGGETTCRRVRRTTSC
jgi:hypothetical protein